MSDQFIEQPRQELGLSGRPPIEVATKVMASPDHPDYTADKGVAKELLAGRSGIIAAIDGVGSGGKASAQAAEIVQNNLNGLETKFVKTPTINEAVIQLKNAIFGGSVQIKELQSKGGNPDVDTTVSAGIVCGSPDGKRRFLLTANAGDSRIYRYRPNNAALEQLTTDNSLVQELVKAGVLSPEQAF